MDEEKNTREYWSDANYYGSENYYKITFHTRFVVTDGMKAMSDTLGCYWFSDMIASTIRNIESEKLEFATCLFHLDENSPSGKFLITDGNDKIVFQQNIPFSDCQTNLRIFLKRFQNLWVGMLPSEN